MRTNRLIEALGSMMDDGETVMDILEECADVEVYYECGECGVWM